MKEPTNLALVTTPAPKPGIRVHSLPAGVKSEELRHQTVVVIDVLRATTTICQALAAGAVAVWPFLEIDDARSAAAQHPEWGLGGERGGRKISGFDWGNSPLEYTPDAVAGRALAFTTTNGTRALLRCSAASEVYLGAFANRSALVARLDAKAGIDILCAGTEGQISWEDMLVAGALVTALHRPDRRPSNDGALIAEALWQQISVGASSPEDIGRQLVTVLRQGQGGQNLIEIGQDADIVWAAQLDRLTVVPQWDARRGSIVVA